MAVTILAITTWAAPRILRATMPLFPREMFTGLNTGICTKGYASFRDNAKVLEPSLCCSVPSRPASSPGDGRTFSIAITAWSAKVSTSSICLSVNGSSLILVNTRTPTGFSLAQHWHAERGAYPCYSGRLQQRKLWIAADIRNVSGFAFNRDTTDDRCPVRSDRMLPHVFDMCGKP